MRFRPLPSRLTQLVALTTLLSAAPMVAQDVSHNGGTVLEGTVVSATGTALVGLRISVPGGTWTLSDSAGHFSVETPTLPTELRVSGFGVHALTILVGERPESRLRIVLQADAIVLQPIKVLMDRTRLLGDPTAGLSAPGSGHLLTRADMRKLSNPHENVHQALRLLPGVNVQEEDGFGLRPNIGLRGTGSERSSKITLMEDGVLIAPAPYAAPAAYYFPTLARMNGVEVRKGSSQIRFGPRTVGGAINLISTPIPDGFSWEGHGAGGPDGAYKALARVGGRKGALGWLAETVHLGSRGFKELPGNQGTGFLTSDYLIKMDMRSSMDARWFHRGELKISRTDHESDETYLGLTDLDFGTQPLSRYAASALDRMTGRHNQVQARYFLQGPRLLDLTVTAYRNGFRRNWYKLQSIAGSSLSDVLADPAEFGEKLAVLKGADSGPSVLIMRANNRSYVSRGIDGVVALRGGQNVRHTAQLGIRIHGDHEDRLQFEDSYRMVTGRLDLTAPGAPGTQANRFNEARARSFFLQDEVRYGDLTVLAGVRHEGVVLERTDWRPEDPHRRASPERTRESRVSAWIPGVGATWSPSARLAVFAGVHRGFAPPGPGSDDRTQPETSVNNEVGFRFRQPDWSVEATGFLTRYTNVLGQAALSTGGDGSGDLFNGGEVRTTGVEALVTGNLASLVGIGRDVPVRVVYTWTRSRFQTGFDSDFEPWGTVRAGDELPYLSPHQLGVTFGWVESGWEVAATVTAASAMRTQAGQGTLLRSHSTDAVTTVGVRGSFDVGRSAVLTWAVDNLTDARHIVSRRPAGVRPNVPRTLIIGLTVRGGEL